MDGDYLNVGVYPVPMAARLLKLPARTVRSWFANGKASPPISVHDFPPVDQEDALSFEALIELLIVRRLRERNVSLQHLRKVLDHLRDVFNDIHPFAQNMVIYTDARRQVFMETVEESGDSVLLNIIRDQYEMREIIDRVLTQGIEFSEITNEAQAWWPDRNLSISVVIRPSVAFGAPVIDGTGIRSAILFQDYLAERQGDPDNDEKAILTVSDWHEIEPAMVKDAVLFERMYAA